MNYTDIIEPNELNIWIEQKKSFQLIDISEENYLQFFDIKTEWIPATSLLNDISKIKKDIPVVLCCRHGVDSFFQMNILHVQHQLTNVLSLNSGIYGWKSLRKT